jgi:hypothetical protein
MSFLKEKEIDDPQTSDDNQNFEIEFSENEKGFQGSFLVKQEMLSKIKNLKLDLKKEKIFRIPFSLNILKRKNNIFYFVSTKEMHVDIKDTKGSVFLSLINKDEIRKNLLKIDSKIRSTISMVHLGAVKILLKSEFQEGIDSPIKMALIDNRIKDRRDCILGAARGNLAYQKFMFSVYPKFGLSLDTKNLDTVLSFVHQFERENLMDAGDKVFSISYVVAYALTNSHHSIDYKKSEYIELEDIFSDIGSIEEKQFSEISPLENSWAIDIARNKPHLGEKPRMSFKGKNLLVGESSTDSLLRNVSTRIDTLSQKLELLS